MSDFACCETRPVLPRNQQVDAYDRGRWGATLSDADLDAMRARSVEREIEREAASVARWIAAATLDRFPNGPYAVHAYYPATGREITVRNQTAGSAVVQAEQFTASGKCRDVHVSLDTCG